MPALVESALLNRRCQRCSQIHHRYGCCAPSMVGVRMGNGDLIVIGKSAVRVRLIDLTDADHAETVALRRTQRSHTAGTVDTYASVEGIEDFAMPHGLRLVKHPVHNGNRFGCKSTSHRQKVALRNRR